MATDMVCPPGVTRWRSGAADTTASTPCIKASAAGKAKPRRIVAPGAMASGAPQAGGASSKRFRVNTFLCFCRGASTPAVSAPVGPCRAKQLPTARQIHLQRALGLPTPVYLHTPLVLGANGQKLSKQNGAKALDTSTRLQALDALNAAALALGLTPLPNIADEPAEISVNATAVMKNALADWTRQWRSLYLLDKPHPLARSTR